MKIAIILMQLTLMLLAGCSGMSYDRYDQTKWQAKIYSNPPGAEIFVDGVSIGNAPLGYSYPSVGMSKKKIVARFPSGSEQSLITGYYIFEIFFDFVHNKATIKEYPEALSLVAETREVQFETSVPLTSEMMQNALSGIDEMRAMLPGGTSMEPATQPKPPDVNVGPLIEILKVKTGVEKVKVLADTEGQARVLVSSEKLQQVLEIIVRPEGIVKSRVIRSGKTPDSIDGAFDAQGRFHVMLDAEHLILEDDAWQTSNQTPWHESGLKVWGVRYVPGAPDLTWVFQLSGADLDTPVRMEIYGFGGYGAGIIWPWFTHGSRTVLVSEVSGGYGPWFVIEPQGKEDTFATSLASDHHANVYVLFERSRGGFANASSYFYMFIDSRILKDSETSIPDVTEIQAGTRRIRAGKEGSAGFVTLGPGRVSDKQVAADPESGTALVGLRFVVRGKTWSAPKEWPPSSSVLRVEVSPGGQDSFHALVVGEPLDKWWGEDFPIQYLLFSAGGWSAPLELGHADVESFWGHVWDAVGITNVGNDKALLVWPTEQGIVGRWIQHSR